METYAMLLYNLEDTISRHQGTCKDPEGLVCLE